MRALRTVLIRNPESGDQQTFVRGDDVPDDWSKHLSDEVRTLVFEEEEDDEEQFTADGERRVTSPNSLAEGETVGKSNPNDDYDNMTVPELRREAASRDIDLGDANRKQDIIAKLREADAA